MEPMQLLFKNRLTKSRTTPLKKAGVDFMLGESDTCRCSIAAFAECIRYSNRNRLVVPSITYQGMQTQRRSFLIGILGQEIAGMLVSCFSTVLIFFSVHTSFRMPFIFFCPHPNCVPMRTQMGKVVVCSQCQPKLKTANTESEAGSCWLQAVCYFCL